MTTRWRVILISLGSLIALLCYMALEPLWIRTRYVDVRSVDVPSGFIGYRIVFISDIHFGPYLGADRLRRAVDQINRVAPDMVIIGGDYISYSSRYIEPCFDVLKGIRTKDGVYCVLGNHDHWVDSQTVRDAITKNGFHSIDNQANWIERRNSRILVAGVGDWWEDSQMTDTVLRGATFADFCVLVSHNPDYFAEQLDDRIDLALSGHTHGGQVTLFGLYAPVLPVKHKKYRHGLYGINGEKLYVTSGLGVISPPLRFFCRPEIVVFDLSR
jgi:predicted MPP superfamily phosphohydrolase